MKYFPIFLNVKNQHVAVVGGSDAAIAKLRLLLKTEGQITLYDESPAPKIMISADAGLWPCTGGSILNGVAIRF